MFKHKLGLKVKSRAYGMVGLLMSRSESLYGCNRYYIQPKIGKDGKIPDGIWFDEDDIEVIGKGIEQEKKNTGGPASKMR